MTISRFILSGVEVCVYLVFGSERKKFSIVRVTLQFDSSLIFVSSSSLSIEFRILSDCGLFVLLNFVWREDIDPLSQSMLVVLSFPRVFAICMRSPSLCAIAFFMSCSDFSFRMSSIFPILCVIQRERIVGRSLLGLRVERKNDVRAGGSSNIFKSAFWAGVVMESALFIQTMRFL